MNPDSSHTVTGGGERAPAHAARPAIGWRAPVLAAGAAGLAAVTGLALLHGPERVVSTPPSARSITVTPTVGLPAAELAGLVDDPLDAGPLGDPDRRAGCLSALGYPPGTPVLGARQLQVDGRSTIVLVLAGPEPDKLRALAVRPDCGYPRPGLIAEQVVPRP